MIFANANYMLYLNEPIEGAGAGADAGARLK